MANIVHGVKLFWVPQGSILGSLWVFYFLEDFDITNYADDSTPYNADKNT